MLAGHVHVATATHRLSSIPGSSVEHNTFCVSAHFRNCEGDDWERVVACVEQVRGVGVGGRRGRGRWKWVWLQPQGQWGALGVAREGGAELAGHPDLRCLGIWGVQCGRGWAPRVRALIASCL